MPQKGCGFYEIVRAQKREIVLQGRSITSPSQVPVTLSPLFLGTKKQWTEKTHTEIPRG
jgi:hypothetical protein